MNHFFINIHKWLNSNKIIAFILFFCWIAIIGLLASKIQFEENITKLIPHSEKSDITNKVINQVSFADKIVVYIEAKKDARVEDLTDYATELVTNLTDEDYENNCIEYIKDIQGKINEEDIEITLNFVYDNLPLFLEKEDYAKIEQKLDEDSIKKITEANYKTLISPSGIIAKKNILKDPLGLSFIGLKKLQNLQATDNFELYNGFLITKDHKNLLLFINPKLPSNETDENSLFVNKLYKAQNELNVKYKAKVESQYYGSTVIAVANASQIKADVQITISIAISILLLILVFFYKRIYTPLILFTPTLIGGLTAIAFLYLFKEKISSISLGIGSVLLGITLDYSLHILTHFKRNSNKKQLYIDVTKPVLMSSFTTATAFLCLLFLKSEALQDLGIFASISVITSSVFALILIPLVYKPVQKTKQSNNIIDIISSYKYHKSKIFILWLVICIIVSVFTYKNVTFDKDISKMNYQTETLKLTENKLNKITNSEAKSIYSIAYGKTLEKALSANNKIAKELERLERNAKIKDFNSIGSIVLSKEEQENRIGLWNDFWSPTREKLLETNLIKSGESLGFKPTTFQEFYATIDKHFSVITIDDYRAIKALFIDEFISSKSDFYTVSSLVKIKSENYNEVTNILNSNENQVTIDRKQMNETFLGNLKTDFNSLLKYSFIAVILILLLFYRSFELTFITILPIGITWLITVGVMGLLKIDFNIFNIIISTFIFGLGVDYSIFIANGLSKQYKNGSTELPVYKTSILLSVITTVLGIGVLIFAKHPALKSISLVSIIGIISAMMVTFTLQPLIFRLLVTNRTNKGLAPIRIRTFLHTIVLFAFYGLGGILLSLFSITILPLLPISKRIKMKWLHKVMAKLITATLYGNPFVKKKVINSTGETFKKPAIIISNHASFLDTLTIGMTTHNVIYLVNDWVYNSPIFGVLARVAGFYPVSSGIDGSLEHLQEKINQGYSLVVFPESRRSFNNKVGRFHKGAFFLANKLKLDILPLYLHGNSEVQPKRDFIIYDGSLTVEIGERIKYESLKNFGKTDREQTKNIASFYKNNYLKIRDEIEGSNYFKTILMSNYQYKGYELFNLINLDFKVNKKAYKQISDFLPDKGIITHIANDYGQIDILLISKYIDRRITTLIENEDKNKIARNCYSSFYRGVKYISEIQQLSTGNPDTLIISKKYLAKDFGNLDLLNYKNINSIILLNNINLVAHFEHKGFVLKQTKNKVTHLIRV